LTVIHRQRVVRVFVAPRLGGPDLFDDALVILQVRVRVHQLPAKGAYDVHSLLEVAVHHHRQRAGAVGES
jgi:hypothetical protein